jgi:WD40 repeat protein
VAFSADGTTILTQSSRLARIWNARTGTTSGHDVKTGASDYAVLLPDGRALFLGFDESRLVNVSSGESTKVPFWPHHDRNNRMAMFSPDGTLLVAAGNTEEEIRDYELAEVWRVGSDKLVRNTMSHRGRFTTVAFSSDGDHLLTGGDDNTAHVWTLSGNELIQQGPPLIHGGSVVSAAFGDDRARGTRMVLTGSTDKTARLWRFYNLQTTLPTSDLFRHGGSVDSVAISADSRTILTGSSDGIARLWNRYARTNEQRAGSREAVTPPVDPSTLRSKELDAVAALEPTATIVAISHDRDVVALRGDDHTVRLRRVSTGERVGKPLTHEDAVSSVEFSPDGRTLLTASGDTKARFWDVASGALLGDPLLHSYKVQRAQYTSDGRRVITRASGPYVSDDGYWNVFPPAVDKPECLKRSIEWRTGFRIDATQRISRLTQSEWLASKRQVDALGGPCDVGRWDGTTK